MIGLLQAPALASEDATRKARLLLSVVRTMGAMGGLALLVSLLDPANHLGVTLAFYLPIFAALFVLASLVQRGHVVLAGWIVSLFFWLLIAFVTLFFGGLQGENAATFGVAVLLIGIVVGGRIAVALAVASSVWCGVVGFLELRGLLPPQLGTYSVINAWSALTVTLVLTSVLLRAALDSLQQMHQREEEAAAARDEALRRSIQAQKMELVGTLTAGIAHDFNNLLTVIGGAGSVLRETAGRDPADAEILDDLEAATSRAALMTRQLLAFGRAPTTESRVLELGELVRASASMLPRLLGSSVEVVLEVSEGCWVEASRAGLEQVVLNLAVNARDAMPRGGRLVLRVRPEGERVLLSATDDGVGMDEATKARIFEPFFTTKGTGTGLGLATVRDLVARFSGEISVRSSPGAGATFELRLPLVAPPEEERATAALPTGRSDGGPPRRILLVEDDALVRRTASRLLEQEGFEVVAVTDGDEALALLDRSESFACVVTDCSMRRVSGEELAGVLATRAPSLPVLLMSGHRTPPAELLAAPGRAFVEKPIDLPRLREALRGLLAAARGAGPSAPAAAGEGRVAQMPAAARTLLLADDDPEVRAWLVRSLSRIGYEIQEVASGEEALARFEASPDRFSAALLDLGMPGMGGLAAGDQLRVRLPGLPILYMSGDADPRRLGDRLLAPRTAFLEKPPSGAALKAAVERLLSPQP